MFDFLLKIDASIIEWVYQIHHPILDKIMITMTTLGNGGLIWIILTLILLLQKKYRKIGLMLAFSLILGSIFGEIILKPFFKRPRPFIELPNLKLLIIKPSSYSFPSGHTTSSFATVGIAMKMFKKKWHKSIIILLAFLIAFSRIYLTVHYPSDVLFGAILGIICANIVLYTLSKK